MALGRALMREALLRRDEGKYRESANLAREAVVLFDGADIAGEATAAEALAEARIELAEVLRRDSQLDEAAKLSGQAVADFESRARGTASHVAALFMHGRILQARGDLEGAEPLLRRAYDLQLKLTGPVSDDAVDVRSGLAELLMVRGKTGEADALLRENIEAVREIYGEASAMLGIAWNNLANALSDIPTKLDESEQAYLESIRLLEAALAPGHPEIATAHANLGALYLAMQRFEEAGREYRTGLELRMAALGPEHPNTLNSRMGVALAMNRLGQQAEAEAIVREVKAAFTKSLGANHWRTANVQYHLGVVLKDGGKLDEALVEVRQAHGILLADLGANHPRTAAATATLAELEAAAPSAVRTAR
jgi:tetratricopeptide (TPR) repeat protein